MKKPIYLLLLPLFFVLHGYEANFPAIPVKDALVLFVEYFIATVILYFILFALFKSQSKTALLSFLLLSYYFFFGSLHDFAKEIIPRSFFLRYMFILPATLLCVVAGFIFFRKTKKEFVHASKYLNLLFICLLLFDLFNLTNKRLQKKEESVAINLMNPCDRCNKPDVFLIIADEYAGTRELQEIFHYDNTEFLNSLVEKGFHIVKNPTSNYNSTPFSMASLLNMEYLPPMKAKKINEQELNRCIRYINTSNVAVFFKQLGYSLKNYSYFDLDNIPAKAESRFLHNRIKLISGQTFISRINKDIRFNLITKYKWKPEMKRFANSQLAAIDKLYESTLNEINQTGKPRFIYTHLMMPHYPYFFDSAGKQNDVELLMEGQQVRQKEYLGYLKYCNNKLLYLVDQILKNSKTPPIILLMSDHGFREFTDATPEKYYFMNLNAIFLPDKNYSGFYDGMSNVNQFRVLLNKQFGQSFPLLKDSTIFLKE